MGKPNANNSFVIYLLRVLYIPIAEATAIITRIRILPIFNLIQEVGGISERDMFNTYNMGVGMSIVVSPEDVEKALEILKANGEDAYVIGSVSEGTEKIVIA